MSSSCQNEFASLVYFHEHPKTRFTTLWTCGASFACQYIAALVHGWTCVLEAALQWGQVAQGSSLPHLIVHGSFKALEGFVSNILFVALQNLYMKKTE